LNRTASSDEASWTNEHEFEFDSAGIPPRMFVLAPAPASIRIRWSVVGGTWSGVTVSATPMRRAS
jgi:hypothetical protein